MPLVTWPAQNIVGSCQHCTHTYHLLLFTFMLGYFPWQLLNPPLHFLLKLSEFLLATTDLIQFTTEV